MGVPHEPTPELRAAACALASFGIRLDKVAKYIGISEPTLRKYYGDELNRAKLDKIVQVANALFFNATENMNVPAQIFFLKTQAGWRETDRTDDDAKDDKVDRIEIEVIRDKRDN